MTKTIQQKLIDQLIEASLQDVVFEGWTKAALKRAGKASGMSDDELEVALNAGVSAIVMQFFERSIDLMVETYEASEEPKKIREKVAFALKAWVTHIEPREAYRRAIHAMLLPGRAHQLTKLHWRVADTIWRLLKDPSTDYNWYTKRLVLSTVIGRLLHKIMRNGDDFDLDAYIDARINDVMQFEKVKGRVLKASEKLPDVTHMLAKLRYGPLGRRG